MESSSKNMVIRIPKELWVFMKTQSISQENPVNKIMINLIEKYKRKVEKGVDIE